MDDCDILLRNNTVPREAKDALTPALFRPRGLPLLLAVSFILGAALTLTMLPLPVILGNAGFWNFPHGTVPGGIVDMAQTMIGYNYFALAPWTLPVLNIPNLVPPAGTNLLWLDAVPLLCLLNKIIVGVSGTPVNLIGAFLFLCFSLPGAAMTAVFWANGQRGLICAIVAAALADSMPFLLFEWGHVALCAQFLIILALLLYLLSQRRPTDYGVSAAWIALLLVTSLTSNYLFVMVGGLWFAAMLQRTLNRQVRPRRSAVEVLATIAIVAIVAAIMGILSWDLRFGGTDGFGVFSMNLGSPFVPQLSGALPPLATYWIGMRSQVFDYMGIGVIVVLLSALTTLLLWPVRRGAASIALIGVLGGFVLFALSNRITLGSHTLLLIPLPEKLANALGAFRASGRFFWPVGYAVTIAGTLVVLRSFRPRTTLVILAVASVLQVIDSFPQRRAIAASARRAAPAVIDRQQVDQAMAMARGIMMFPTFGCAALAIGDNEAPEARTARLEQASVEIQLLASRRNLPINSALTDRLPADCAAETQARRAPLDPDTAYFYLSGLAPEVDQLSGHDPAKVCRMIDWIRYCIVQPGQTADALAAPP